MVADDLLTLNRQLCEELFAPRQVSIIQTSLRPPALVFPRYRSGAIRYSEQESRFLFCHLLHALDLPYYYSVETPTDGAYRFTGNYSLSAQSDISLWGWRDDTVMKLANVEFKAGQPAPAKINKDIEKLVSEPVSGYWFHTLKNADSGTLKALFGKLMRAFGNLPQGATTRDTSILFCFCVIEERRAYLRQFRHSGSIESLVAYAESFFYLPLRVSRDRVRVENETAWMIIERP